MVSDEMGADSIQWVIHVVEWYIDAYQPDSLDLICRRNETIDFSVLVRAVDNDPPIEYFWLRDGDWLLDEDDNIVDADRHREPIIRLIHRLSFTRCV